MPISRPPHRRRALAASMLFAFVAAPAVAQVSFFDIDDSNATTGTMNLSASNLGTTTLANLSALATGSSSFNYATVFFVPTNSGTYTFGQSQAPVDTVMILYQGVFDPTAPAQGALAGDDDTGEATHRAVIGDPGALVACGGNPDRCPQVTTNVTAGERYSVVISTFSQGAALGLPMTFYVDGLGNFFFTPPPATAGVLAASTAMANSPALGAARVIDANPELLALFAGLNSDAEISNAASQTLPLLTAGSALAARNAMAGINQVVQSRMDTVRGLSSGDAFMTDRHFWVKPFGSWADQGNLKGVSGFKSDTVGLALGIDADASQQLRLGVSLAYAKADVDSKSRVAPQEAKIDVYQLIGYGSYDFDERTFATFHAGIGRNDTRGRRTIAFTDTVARSSYASTTAQLGAALARTYTLNERTSVTPSVRLDYSWIRDESYRERGADLLNLNVKSRTSDELVLGFDTDLKHQLNERTDLAGSLGVGYDVLDERASITAAFAGAPGAAFTTRGLDNGPWLARGNAELTYVADNGAELALRYDVEHRRRFLNQTASVNVRWAF